MQSFEQINEYCNKVCEQIRWKKAKPIIIAEVENHLYDQRDAYMASGDDENTATQKAIVQMGDAVFLGQELDKTHKPRPQWFMITLTGILMLLGLFINYYINVSTESKGTFSILSYFFAFGIFVCCYYIDFTVLGKHAMKIYLFILTVSIVGVLFCPRVNVRQIWIMGMLSISLTYLSLIFPLAFSLFVYSMREKGIRGILMSGLAYLPLAFLLTVVPTISGLILYTITSLAVLCFSISRGWFGVNKKHGLLLVSIPTVIMSTAFFFFIVHRMWNRISVFLNPEQARQEAGYQYCLIRDFITEAVFWGKGGVSEMFGDISALPNVNTDYPLVYLIHQFGFVVLLFITLLVVIFSIIGIYKALREKSILGSLVALTVILTFTLQSVFFIIDNLGYGLISGLSLPFVSYGNTALFLNAALIGFMLSIFRTGEIVVDRYSETKLSKGNQSIFSYEDGKIIINLNTNHS